MDKLEQQIGFILETDRLKQIVRQSYIADGSRKENDAEHSWHLALMCILLKEYAGQETDILKVITMVLIHDIVEIDAGDTYAYDKTENETKREREVCAADRLFHLLPEEQGEELRELWEEFEAQDSPEAKFAGVLDKVQPLLLNDITGGKAWKEHGVKEEQILERNVPTAQNAPALWEYCKKLIDQNCTKGNIIRTTES